MDPNQNQNSSNNEAQPAPDSNSQPAENIITPTTNQKPDTPPESQPQIADIAPTMATPEVPAAPVQPAAAVAAPGVVAPQPIVSGVEPMAAPAASVATKSRRKPLLIGLVTLAVLAGGAAAYYFGYYTNPSVILSQSLGNTGKGYTKLVNYLNQQNKLDYKGAIGSGSYSLKSGSATTDGKLSFKSDGTNSDTSFDVGLGVTRVTAEVMTIKSTGTNPDVYIKATGIKGFGALTGSPEIDNTVNQLDGKWVVIDHSLLDNLTSKSQAKSTNPLPTNEQIMDEVNAFGQVNQQYVFTTNKSKSITVVQKKYGIETVGGHKAYHYKMAFNKANLKKYITAERDALNSSKLDAWIKANNYQQQVTDSYNQLEKSVDNIKSSDTFDLWSDVNSRLVYKVRFSDTANPATNYVDLGLDYKNGTSFPFFISGKSSDSSGTTTVSAVATLDTKSNNLTLKLNVGSSGTTLSANLTFKPSNQAVSLTAPSGAESLMQVMDQLGLGDAFNSYVQSSGSSAGTSSGAPLTFFQ